MEKKKLLRKFLPQFLKTCDLQTVLSYSQKSYGKNKNNQTNLAKLLSLTNVFVFIGITSNVQIQTECVIKTKKNFIIVHYHAVFLQTLLIHPPPHTHVKQCPIFENLKSGNRNFNIDTNSYRHRRSR